MTKLLWDQVGERRYETGADHGVLYIPDNGGHYNTGVSWNGLTTVTETPSGAEASAQYADNIKYLNLISAEDFACTIEALTYPDEFEQFDGSASPVAGLTLGQQGRKSFGFSYRSRVGNDIDGTEFGYKLHLIYGAQAAPSERAYGTINDSPEAIGFSWECSTTPAPVGEVGGTEYKPTAILTLDSTKLDADTLSAVEDILYGTAGADPRLPLPAEVIGMFLGTTTEVETVAPTYDSATDMVTIPTVTGVTYFHDGEPVTGTFGPITDDTVFTAEPAAGYRLSDTSDTDWTINYS